MEQDPDAYGYSDAWVLVTLMEINKTELNFPEIIAVGDALNHAIFMPMEIRLALLKAQMCELIHIEKNASTLVFSIEWKELRKEVMKLSRFKRIDFLQKKLNESYRKELVKPERTMGLFYITDEFFAAFVKEYHKSYSNK